MPDTGSFEGNKALLEKIIGEQRRILAANVNPDLSQLPQVWTLFTEVQKYWEAGLKLPDDVTILFADDNVGNLRRLPTARERQRSGGSGIYYHMDMNGGPFSYKWLNSNPLPHVWEQMNLAWRYGADRLWVVNVGDIKPLEVPLEFFLRMAWDPQAFTPETISDYQIHWAEREFGDEHAAAIAQIVARYAKLNASPKPELVNPSTFSLLNYREAESVLAAWKEIEDQAQKLYAGMPAEKRDAFYELVLHPVLACGNAVEMNIAAARNHLFIRQGRASANDEAQLVHKLFARDQELSDYYNHQLLGGKWEHMMDQVHIGYTSWESPKENILPAVESRSVPDEARFGVAVEGSEKAWPQRQELELPVFDSLNSRASYIEVFPLGTRAAQFQLTASQPWIVIHEARAFSSGAEDRRFLIQVDWSKAPAGKAEGVLQIRGENQQATVKVRALKASPEQVEAARSAFGGQFGPISILAGNASRASTAYGLHWAVLPDYGRSRSAVTVLPITDASIPPGHAAPTLEYDIYLAKPGSYDFDLVTNPTMDFMPGNALAVAVSLDDRPSQSVASFTAATQKDESFLGRNFYENAKNNARVLHGSFTVKSAGRHTLKIAMINPGFVLEKIVVHNAELPPSFFGPPERPANGQ
jgi:hypothetical protein